jgi:hypothetical protein
VKASRLSSWGLTAVLLSSIACGSSGGGGTGTGGHAGASATGGHAGSSATGGHAGGGMAGAAGGAAGGGVAGSGGGTGGSAGAGGALGGHGGLGGAAGGAGAGGAGTGGAAGGAGAGGAGGAPQSTNFALSLNPSSAMVAQAGQQMVTVTVDRNVGSTAFAGAIMLTVQGAPTGVTAMFVPATIPQASASSTLTLSVASTVATGSYSLSVVGTSGSDTYSVPLPLTVTAPATLVLVDDDNSENNDPANTNPTPSASDTDFANWLQTESITNYNAKVSQSNGTPTFTELQTYQTIIWYAGDSTSTPSAAKQQTLQDLIDAGGKTVILFDENLYYALNANSWTGLSNGFVTTYVGGAGAVADLQNAATDYVASNNFVGTGVTGPFATLSFQFDKDSFINSAVDATNPGTGTDILVTVPGDPTQGGTDSATPVVVGHKHAGTAGTSTVIYVGIPVENIHGAPKSTAQQFFHAILVYAGLKAS